MAGQTIDGDLKMSTPVIGLDRDGTINVDIGTYVTKPEDFKPIEGSLEAVKMIRNKGYDVVILTNQAGIMKGIMDPVDVDIAIIPPRRRHIICSVDPLWM